MLVDDSGLGMRRKASRRSDGGKRVSERKGKSSRDATWDPRRDETRWRRKRATHIQSIEQQIPIHLRIPLEQLNVLEHLLVDDDLVDVSNRVLSEEVEPERVGWILDESDVFDPERTASNGIGFVLSLLVSSSKSELVDEVHGCGSLSIGGDLVSKSGGVVLSDSIDETL